MTEIFRIILFFAIGWILGFTVAKIEQKVYTKKVEILNASDKEAKEIMNEFRKDMDIFNEDMKTFNKDMKEFTKDINRIRSTK